MHSKMLIGTRHPTSGMPPAIAVVENETARNIEVTGNENKISYEAEAKQILSHSPIPSGMKGNTNNSSNQLQQQSALHNQPSLQVNFMKHALPSPVPTTPLAYETTDLIENATDKVPERQQQRRKMLDNVTLNETIVQAKISTILANLTNEDCTGYLATARTREAHLNACRHGFADLEASAKSVTSPNQQPSQHKLNSAASIIKFQYYHAMKNRKTTRRSAVAQNDTQLL
ncbi:hypothetical protein GQX74_005745 [Glossina fuscipes]|nr:hypothetical protein GQX74_005745 [Glossina fuscipes]